jgi:NAD(P)-dependent dehydrogenase (short-subunit alcohol dehydrogenase family)
MEGRVCVVTGSNTGIGKVTARELARRGAEVVMACRSEERTRPVVEEIKRETGNERVSFEALDLASLAQVRKAAERLRERRAIHVLINNAGLAAQKGQTEDGFELAFGVNHVGPFLLTQLLLPKLRASTPARVVHVASKAHYKASSIDWDAVTQPTRSFSGYPEYCVSKLANVLYNAELARRLPDRAVTTYALHPGVIASDIWRNVPWPIRPLMKMRMISNEEGAQTTLHCATAPERAEETGLYYDRCEPKEPSRVARDAALARELFDRSLEWTGAPPV